jgi:hypothetical protein
MIPAHGAEHQNTSKLSKERLEKREASFIIGRSLGIIVVPAMEDYYLGRYENPLLAMGAITAGMIGIQLDRKPAAQNSFHLAFLGSLP